MRYAGIRTKSFIGHGESVAVEKAAMTSVLQSAREVVVCPSPERAGGGEVRRSILDFDLMALSVSPTMLQQLHWQHMQAAFQASSALLLVLAYYQLMALPETAFVAGQAGGESSLSSRSLIFRLRTDLSHIEDRLFPVPYSELARSRCAESRYWSGRRFLGHPT